jgi:ATP-dependent DNA helicase RecG
MKFWVQKAKDYLDHSLGKVPQELNELDWKETLSPKNDKLCQHICAFSNLPGGGYMIFGIEDKTATPKGINQTDANAIVGKLSSLCRDGVDPLISIDHSIEEFRGVQLLFIHIKESSVKPVHLATKTIEDSYIRSGGSTRKASRQEIGGLMLNSKTPVFEELNASKLKNEVEIMTLLDYATIYRLLKKPIPSNIPEIMLWLKEEKMIVEVDGNGYYISNFGALAGDSDEPDHLIPGQADHQFRGKLTRGFRDKLTTLNV